MNLYVDTIASFIQKQLSNPGNADAPLVFMVPEISGADAVALMAACKNLAIAAGRPAVVVASRECMAADTWTDEERRAFEREAGEKSLTYFRNKPEGRPLAVLLGTADAGDSGSLDDFFQCDSKTVFDLAMEKKFNGWVLKFLEEGGVQVPQSRERIRDWATARGSAWNDVLDHLRDATSLADVSRLLASVLAAEPQSSDEDDWFCAVLRHLPGLPNLSGFVEYAKRPKKHRTFRHYADLARDFANYHGSFLDENAKKKRLDAIAAFRAADPRPEVDPAPFATVDELLDALDAYVRNHETGRLDDLKEADFVVVADRILGAKPVREPSDRETKDSVKKLSGSPVETLLMGAWLALGKFWKAFAAEDGTPATPESIEFKGILYKFRREGVVDAADALEDAKMVLGGLDGLVTEHLRGFSPVAKKPPVAVSSDLLPADLQTKNAGQSDPSFVFQVTIRGEGHEIRSKFALLLPDIHAYRLAGELVLRAKEAMDRACADPGKRLPVFHLPYYRELLLSRDEEETAYVLDSALKADVGYDSFATFLFTDKWRHADSAAPLARAIEDVDRRFREFLDDAVANGLHAAVGGRGIPFVNAYRKAVGDYTESDPAAAGANKAAAMLLRAFLFVDERTPGDDAWKTADFEPSALVTVLHPGLLEMLQAQWVFLFEAFFYAATEAYRSDAENPFREGRWTYYEDLAGLKYPLTGLPVRQGGAFELSSNGTGLLFRIGSLPATDATVSTRFLTKVDDGDDDGEEIAAGNLFRETSESRLLRDRLEDYSRMHPESADGLSVAVYRNEDVQPILSGIDAFLRSLPERDPASGPFALRLVVFSESSDTNVVSRWLSAWQDYIESDDGEDAPYPGCRIAVSHRLVAPDNGGCEAFARVIREEVDADVFVLYNFIRPDGNGCRFEPVGPYDRTRDSIKFPILEQAQVACRDPDALYHRSQIVSNRQFAVSDEHANLSRRLTGGIAQGAHFIVLSDGDFSPWRCVVDAAHEAAEWVVAIDPLVDRTLIGKPADDVTGPSRELIGFGTGVGQHGESNFTVSTQQTDLQGLATHLKDAMRREVFRYGTPEADERIAQHLLREARELSGLSIVRAVGPGQYVRDFLAYALLRKMLPTDGTEHLCNRIFSIDAYRHWFDIGSEENRTHPDLLWLVADIDATGSFRLSARLIECKMAESAGMDALLDHAFDQIQNGLKVLSSIFAPRAAAGDLPPDARYWYLQLHRLIANGVSDVPSDRKAAFLQAMERLADGDFSIEWDAAIYTFIADDIADASLRRLDRAADFPVCGRTLNVQAYQCGYPFIDALCRDDSPIPRAWNAEIDANGVPVPAYAPRADFVDADAPEDIVADDVPEEDDAGDLSVAVADPVAQPSEAAANPAPETQQDQEVATTAESPAGVQPVPAAVVSDVGASTPSVMHAPSATAAVTTAPVVAPSPSAGSIPDRILLGTTDSGREVYWEFGHPKLANRHLLIFGSSGQGKTYAIQTLLCELGRKRQHSLILDYTEGFKTGQLEQETVNSLCPEQHIVRNAPLPIDPFAAYSQNDNGIVIQDRPVDIAKRVAAIFKSVYPDTGPIQHSILINAIKTGLGGPAGLTLEGLKNILDGMAEGRGSNRASIAGLSQRIGNLADENPFESAGSSVGWEDLFADPTHLCHVFQLTGLDRISRRLIVEFVLWDLYAHVRANGRKDKPKVLVLDEVQNLSQDADAPLSNYLAEARKFGISLIMATQSVNNAGSQEFKDKLFLAKQILLFQPPAGSAGEYAKIICDQVGGTLGKDEWKRRLMNLSQGECYAIGPVLDPRTNQLRPASVERIRITSLPDRGF